MAMTSYTTLEVENFKGISKMKLEGLGMVNVFVGGNNVGKTSVLQALAIAKNLKKIAKPVSEYENKDSKYNYRIFRENSEEVSNILFGVTSNCIFDDFNFDYRNTGSGYFKILTDTEEIINSPSEDMDGYTFNYNKNKRVLLVQGALDQKSKEKYYNLDKHFSSYIGTSPTNYNLIVEKIYEDILANGTEKVVLDLLKKIQPNLQDILYVKNDKLVCGLTTKSGARIPLEHMGDGFVKLFALSCVLPLVKKNSKVLLIDEIENGFHYSVQEDMWRMILTAAKDDGTQFFFTTHSYEVLESLNAMTQKIIAEWEQAEGYQDGKLLVGENKTPMEPVCIFSLAKDDTDKVTYKRFNKDSLNGAIALEMELRGKGAN